MGNLMVMLPTVSAVLLQKFYEVLLQNLSPFEALVLEIHPANTLIVAANQIWPFIDWIFFLKHLLVICLLISKIPMKNQSCQSTAGEPRDGGHPGLHSRPISQCEIKQKLKSSFVLPQFLTLKPFRSLHTISRIWALFTAYRILWCPKA